MHLNVMMVAAMALSTAQPAAQPSPSAAAPAKPLASAPATTVNCLLASNVFAQKETDPKAKNLAFQTLYFYLGRIDPRTSEVQLKASLKRAGEALKGVAAGPLMNECAHELQTKAQLLEAVGKDLQQGK